MIKLLLGNWVNLSIIGLIGAWYVAYHVLPMNAKDNTIEDLNKTISTHKDDIEVLKLALNNIATDLQDKVNQNKLLQFDVRTMAERPPCEKIEPEIKTVYKYIKVKDEKHKSIDYIQLPY